MKEQLFYSTHLIYKGLTGKEITINENSDFCILCGFKTDEIEEYKYSDKF